jgi:hypothetical protein
MSIRHENMRVCLTQESERSFLNKLKNNNPEINKKRDMFINQSREKIRVEKTNNGVRIITNMNND